MVRDLWSASGSLMTVRGLAASSWKRTDDSLALAVVVPMGSEAEVTLPKSKLRDVVLVEGGEVVWKANKAAAKRPGILECRETDSALVLRIGSGSYAFAMDGR